MLWSGNVLQHYLSVLDIVQFKIIDSVQRGIFSGILSITSLQI